MDKIYKVWMRSDGRFVSVLEESDQERTKQTIRALAMYTGRALAVTVHSDLTNVIGLRRL